VTVGKYVCGYSQTARVVYPVTSKKVPVISFAHGFLNPGAQAYTGYKAIIEGVAKQGYVVIVLESSSFPLECKNEYKDQLRSLEWIKTSKFANRIDYTKQTGLLGHSMGGGATYRSAGQASAVKTYNIGAAVALNPQIAGFLPTANPQVPIMFGTGSKDTVIVSRGVKSAYDKTSGVPKVYANVHGSTHMGGAVVLIDFAAAYLDCHLLSDGSQCEKIYGQRSDSLCAGQWHKMTECTHANEPKLDSVLV